jgi:hypothetical protein
MLRFEFCRNAKKNLDLLSLTKSKKQIKCVSLISSKHLEIDLSSFTILQTTKIKHKLITNLLEDKRLDTVTMH